MPFWYNPCDGFLQKRVDDILRYHDGADEYLKLPVVGVGVNSTNTVQRVGVKSSQCSEAVDLAGDPLALQILWNLKASPLMTQVELAHVLGREPRTIERKVKKLRDAKLLTRVGSDKTGSWKVMLDD